MLHFKLISQALRALLHCEQLWATLVMQWSQNILALHAWYLCEQFDTCISLIISFKYGSFTTENSGPETLLRSCATVPPLHTGLQKLHYYPDHQGPWWQSNLSLENNLGTSDDDEEDNAKTKYGVSGPLSLHGPSIWEDPSFYRLAGQNTIAFSPYTANLAPLCNITRQKSVTWVFWSQE